MMIRRRYRFYAAHRNPGLADKCARLHGHRYGVEVALLLHATGHGVTTLFCDIDARLAPIFDALDHRTLLMYNDPLVPALGDSVVQLPFASSAENLAAWLLGQCVRAMPGCVDSLSLTETDSATVTATIDDLAEWPR
jgi:hypothetical protein